jgi:GNAT superfamily N-acetyltransferase
MPKPNIRPIQPEDCSRLLELVRELAVFEKLEDILDATEQHFNDAFFGSTPSAECLVAESDDDLIGYAIFFQNFSSFLARPGVYLEDIYVQPAHRGQGVGKHLITAVAHIAAERGAGRFEWVVLDWNERAIEFYKSLGADILHEWRIVRLSETQLKKLAQES